MTFPSTLAGVQDRAAAGAGRDYFSGSEVQGFAASRGISPRSLRRYKSGGLVAVPERVGRGRGQGAEVRYPARALCEIALIAEARKATHSLPRIRHWLWWGGYPIEWTSWHADRIGELRAEALREQARFGMTPAQLEREAVSLAAELGKRRPFPLRGQALRTKARRDQVAQWILDGRYRGVAPDPTEALGEGSDGTVADVLDRLVGQPLRRLGWLEPGSVGAQVSELLVTVPNLGDSLCRFEALSQEQARALWCAGACLEAVGFARAVGYPPLREAPVYAALWLVRLQWALPAATVRELEALTT